MGKKERKYACPECGSNLMYEDFSKTGKVAMLISDSELLVKKDYSNDETSVYCILNREHKIPTELFADVINLVRSGDLTEIKDGV